MVGWYLGDTTALHLPGSGVGHRAVDSCLHHSDVLAVLCRSALSQEALGHLADRPAGVHQPPPPD